MIWRDTEQEKALMVAEAADFGQKKGEQKQRRSVSL